MLTADESVMKDGRSKKLRSTLVGLLIGAAFCLADYFFEWRGNRFVSWSTPAGRAENIGYLIAVLGLSSLIGFIAGWSRERAARIHAQKM